MDIDVYQRAACQTDQTDFGEDVKAEIFHLLGIVDETGSLVTEYKKYLVDGDYYRIYKDRLAEELGDIMWYIANFADEANLNLSRVLENNLQKIRARYPTAEDGKKLELFDEGFPVTQQLPRKFEIKLITEKGSQGQEKVRMYLDGTEVGDPLTDNAYHNDGYRFHDVFHWAYVVYLGWSPVIRKLLIRKRKNDEKMDEVEDGARARIIEEAISALVFNSAEDYGFFEGGGAVDNRVLRDIKSLTEHLEVRKRTPAQWEKAILAGFNVWREINKNGKGVILGDVESQSFEYRPI